jgi:hypothetical protein
MLTVFLLTAFRSKWWHTPDSSTPNLPEPFVWVYFYVVGRDDLPGEEVIAMAMRVDRFNVYP